MKSFVRNVNTYWIEFKFCISWLVVRFAFDWLNFFLHWSARSLCHWPHINQPPFLWLVQGVDLQDCTLLCKWELGCQNYNFIGKGIEYTIIEDKRKLIMRNNKVKVNRAYQNNKTSSAFIQRNSSECFVIIIPCGLKYSYCIVFKIKCTNPFK